MGFLSAFINRARVVSSSPKPMNPSTPSQSPGTLGHLSPHGPPGVTIVPGRELFKDETPTWQEMRLLTGHSAELQEDCPDSPPADWESDPFNAELLAWLPVPPPNHAPLLYQGVWHGPAVKFTKHFMLALAKEALNDGAGPLVTEQFRIDSRNDCSLRKLASDAGIRNSVARAYARTIDGSGQIARAFERGQVPATVAPGLEQFEANAIQFRNAACQVFSQIAQRWAARVFPVCHRLKLAAERLARKQAATDAEYAETYGSEFRASGLLFSCIAFGLTSRIGQGGWQTPWWGIRELGCALPPDPTPWCPDWGLFKLPDDCEADNLLARLTAQAAQLPTSETRMAYVNAQKQQQKEAE